MLTRGRQGGGVRGVRGGKAGRGRGGTERRAATMIGNAFGVGVARATRPAEFPYCRVAVSRVNGARRSSQPIL
ncbi:hypothetical protein JHV675_54580 [Mycobacterium avium subsp. hominissuis]